MSKNNNTVFILYKNKVNIFLSLFKIDFKYLTNYLSRLEIEYYFTCINRNKNAKKDFLMKILFILFCEY